MTKENKTYEFIAYDGPDPETKKTAEVVVMKNRGKIIEFKEDPAKNVAMVKFAVPRLEHPIHGWIGMGTKIHEEAKRVFEAEEDADFRVEIQRKKDVDRSIPMSELRKDIGTANKNIRRILAAVNGIYSEETMTDPAKDPVSDASDNRFPAVDVNALNRAANEPAQAPQTQGGGVGSGSGFNKSALLNAFNRMADTPDANKNIVEILGGLLLSLGYPVEKVNEAMAGSNRRLSEPNPRTYKIEAPPYKEYNSDGRINLGSGQVASGVGVESFVSRNLLAKSPEATPLTPGFDELVQYFTKLAYSIADHSQERAYGTGVPADRGANSHTRVRGLMIDIVERFYPFPVVQHEGKLIVESPGAVRDWTANVGNEILKRFANAINASQSRSSFAELFAELKTFDSLEGPGEAPAEPAAEAAPNAPEAPVAASDAPNLPQEAVTAPEATAKPVTVPEAAPVASAEVPAEPVAAPAVSVEDAERKERLERAKAAMASVTPEVVEAFRQDTTYAEVAPSEDENFDDGIVMEELPNGLITMHLTPEIMAENTELADTDDLDTFKGTLNAIGFNLDSEVDRALIIKILKFTYGATYSNAKMIPSSYLNMFSDWYMSVEPDVVETLRVEANKL